MSWLLKPKVCPGLFYGTPAQDGFLIRIRTLGGLLNTRQGWAIATLVDQWGSEALQVTNRANLPIRAIDTAPTAAVFQTLQTLGLADQNPGLDYLRNVITSPVETHSRWSGGSEREAVTSHLGDVVASELPFLIEQLLNAYQPHRATPNESLGEFSQGFWQSGVRI